MEKLAYSLKEVAEMLGKETDPTSLDRVNDWMLHKMGIKQCPRGFYSRTAIMELERRMTEKCILGNGENSTISRAKSVWATKPLKLKNTARALLYSKMQESMQTVSPQT